MKLILKYFVRGYFIDSDAVTKTRLKKTGFLEFAVKIHRKKPVKVAALLKINFFTGIFHGLWLEISPSKLSEFKNRFRKLFFRKYTNYTSKYLPYYQGSIQTIATYENREVTSIVVKLQKILEYPFSPPNHFLFFFHRPKNVGNLWSRSQLFYRSC